ncbi:hypothetical protein OnM2_059009 [Erysiphe neolycopersici]|uniref:Uncharacterized protein n=1 Tax=Erysiphe neolycopersici TaxID=212602 RepID=A0A420HQ10_9PEZI|nr:hypothetical protein OnM2_059009 [Erysiphe neolycopersici]
MVFCTDIEIITSRKIRVNFSAVSHGTELPIRLDFTRVPSPSFTELNLIIRGSRPSVLRTSCCVLLEESKRMMKY